MIKNRKPTFIGLILGIVVFVSVALYFVDFWNDPDGQAADILMWIVICIAWYQFSRQQKKGET